MWSNVAALNQFMGGAAMLGFVVSGFFFVRFWTKTRDRFFAIFATAFFMLAIERWILIILNTQFEARSLVYIIRLLAFIAIIAAIVEKNRDRSES